MKISEHTRISELIKANPASIDAISSINKYFEKLRNPILRRVLAPRVCIADAAKIGGCSVDLFFKKLEDLGFEVDNKVAVAKSTESAIQTIPDFVKKIDAAKITELDVRTDLASGNDPFQKIMAVLKQMPVENTLLIINTFEPVPLINILNKKGFKHFTQIKPDGIVYTYLKQANSKNVNSFETFEKPSNSDVIIFEQLVKKYEGKINEVDVRDLEMPLPMVTILQELESLAAGWALFIHHKKVPQFLLPELSERNFTYLIKEIAEGDVKLLIYR